MRLLFTALLLTLLVPAAAGQESAFRKDSSFTVLSLQRITTNQRGMVVLGSWAAANIVTGTAGYFLAKDDEWKAFHAMNAVWNVANGVIALGGYAGARRERSIASASIRQLQRYESNKRIYLINAGLDFLYLGTGVYLLERGRREPDPAVWKGFGRSIVLQGAFLLLFDGVMYASHQHRDKQWYKLLEGICVTGNGIGLKYEL